MTDKKEDTNDGLLPILRAIKFELASAGYKDAAKYVVSEYMQEVVNTRHSEASLPDKDVQEAVDMFNNAKFHVDDTLKLHIPTTYDKATKNIKTLIQAAEENARLKEEVLDLEDEVLSKGACLNGFRSRLDEYKQENAKLIKEREILEGALRSIACDKTYQPNREDVCAIDMQGVAEKALTEILEIGECAE